MNHPSSNELILETEAARQTVFAVAITIFAMVTLYASFPLGNPGNLPLWMCLVLAAASVWVLVGMYTYLRSVTRISASLPNGEVTVRRLLGSERVGTADDITSITFRSPLIGRDGFWPYAIEIRSPDSCILVLDVATRDIVEWANAIAELCSQRGHDMIIDLPEPRQRANLFRFIDARGPRAQDEH